MLTQSEILKIISKALDDGSGSEISITTEDSKATVSEWDSLGHLSILSALDISLDGKISQIPDISNFSSVGKLIEILRANNLVEN